MYLCGSACVRVCECVSVCVSVCLCVVFVRAALIVGSFVAGTRARATRKTILWFHKKLNELGRLGS